MREEDIRLRLQDYAEKRKISQASVEAFFLHVRQTIEAHGLKGRYPVLWTYCNWNAHVGLDRAEHSHMLVCLGRRLLPRPPEEFLQDGSGYSSVVVYGGLRIREFRYELRWFLERVGLSFAPLDDELLFRGFVVALLHSLVDKPLKLDLKLVSTSGAPDADKIAKFCGSPRFLGTEVCFVVEDSKLPANLGNPMLRFLFTFIDAVEKKTFVYPYDVWDLSKDPVVRM